jgi:predicted secreted protein
LAKRSVGTKIKIGSNWIAEITEVGGLELSAETIDVTNLSSDGGYREFIGSFKDGGELSISGFFAPGDLGQKGLYEAFTAGSVDTYQILFPSELGASWDFNGVVTGFSTDASLEEAIGFEATIKVSGAPSLGLTASANLTGLSVASISTGAGADTLTPAFSGSEYAYSYTHDGTAVTVTPTLVGVTFDIYVDNTLFQSGLVSGTASKQITTGLSDGKKITILYAESGKSQKMYDIVAVKTA